MTTGTIRHTRHGGDFSDINAAIAAIGAGKVELTEGEFLVTTPALPQTGIALVGAGVGAATIKLVNGAAAATDVVQSSTFAALTGADDAGGDFDMFLDGFTIDGNKANNPTGGWGLRKYGKRTRIGDLVVQNAKAGGFWSEWAASAAVPVADGMEDQWGRIRVTACDGLGIDMRGPHDAYAESIFVHDCTGGGVKVRYLANAYNGSNWVVGQLHTWRSGATQIGLELIGSEMELGSGQLEGHTGVGGRGLKLGLNAGAVNSALRCANLRAFLNEVGIEIDGCGFSVIRGYVNSNTVDGVRLTNGAYQNKFDLYLRDNPTHINVPLSPAGSGGKNIWRGSIDTAGGELAMNADIAVLAGDKFWFSCQGAGTNYTPYGTATITSAATSVNVDHPLRRVLETGELLVLPTNNMGAASHFWVTIVDWNTFTITIDQVPGGADTATFLWRILNV